MSCFQFLLHVRAFLKKQPRIKSELTLLYKRRFQETIFYDTCVSTLRYITQQEKNSNNLIEQQQDQEPFGRKSTRKSVQSVSHYQNAVVDFRSMGGSKSHPNSSSFFPASISNTLAYMSITEKQDLLKQLIQKSYVFVDLSDLFSGEDLEMYENIVRQEVFEGEESIVQSILDTNVRRDVKNRLKYFDTQALHLLNIYVSFCEKIKLKLLSGEGANYSSSIELFLARLILQLKARFQLEFPSQKMSSSSQFSQLISSYKLLKDIILYTLQKTESIRIIPQNSHEYAENFFTYPNISTLVSVILFMDENFLKAIFERFLEGLKFCIGRMGEKLVVVEKVFVDKLKGEYFGNGNNTTKKSSSTQDLFTYKSNLQKILQGNIQIKFPYFKKSLRTLETLRTQREPIKCLKIIYELNKTIEKEHTELINHLISQEAQAESLKDPQQNRISRSIEMRKSQRSKKYSFSRETERMIIQFLLARKKDHLKFIVTNIMITHSFVHESQLKDRKGSCLAPFVQIIKNIGFGTSFQWPF